MYGLFTLVSMVPLAFILRRSPPRHETNPEAADISMHATLSPLGIQASLCIASVGCCVAMSLPLAHIISHVSDLGFNPARGAEVLSVMLGCSVIASLLGVSFLGRRYGGLRALFIFSAGPPAASAARIAFARSPCATASPGSTSTPLPGCECQILSAADRSTAAVVQPTLFQPG